MPGAVGERLLQVGVELEVGLFWRKGGVELGGLLWRWCCLLSWFGGLLDFELGNCAQDGDGEVFVA